MQDLPFSDKGRKGAAATSDRGTIAHDLPNYQVQNPIEATDSCSACPCCYMDHPLPLTLYVAG